MRRPIVALLVTACSVAPTLTTSATTGPAGTLSPGSPPATLAPDPPIVITITTTTITTITTITTAVPTTATPTTVPPTAPPTTRAPTTTVTIPPVPPVVGVIAAEFISLINAERSRRQVPPLAANAELAAHALNWTFDMAASGTVAHSNIASLLDPWVIVGENVGAGGTVDGIWQALINSPLHYANIVDPRFTHLGVGAVISGGTIWVTQVFGG